MIPAKHLGRTGLVIATVRHASMWLVACVSIVGTENAALAQATTSAPIGVTFLALENCEVSGSFYDFGNYVEGETTADVALRNGSVSTSAVVSEGSRAPQVLATVNCPVGVDWSASISGYPTTTPGIEGFIDLLNRNTQDRIPYVGVIYAVDGVAIPGGRVINFGYSGANSVQGAGNGSPQEIRGRLSMFDAQTPLVLQRGIFEGTASIVVSFTPAP